MGEVAFHEETMPTDKGDRIYLRQIYGDHVVYLGTSKRGRGSEPIDSCEDPDTILELSADEATQLHGLLEQFLWARCTRCNAPVDGSEGAPDETLLCDDCIDDHD